jgi:hypothetical protein
MKYATLIIGRAKYPVVTVTDNGESRELTSKAAKEYHARVVSAPWDAYAKQQEAVRAGRVSFKAACDVWTYKQALEEYNSQPRKFGMVKGTPPETNDEVIIEGRKHKVPAGTAEGFITTEAERRFPDPSSPDGVRLDFDQWFKSKSTDKRTWQAEFITGGYTESLEFEPQGWSWGYPIAAAMRELDRLARDGWKLVHISEDHGLYAGADAHDEAYLTRVRYLLSAE